MSKDYICNRHDKVLKNLSKTRDNIRSTLRHHSEDAETLYSLLDNIDSVLYDCIDEIENAKESGQHMEDRLSEYRKAIENLGFSRVE